MQDVLTDVLAVDALWLRVAAPLRDDRRRQRPRTLRDHLREHPELVRQARCIAARRRVCVASYVPTYVRTHARTYVRTYVRAYVRACVGHLL